MTEERRRPAGWSGGVAPPPPHDPDFVEPPEVSRAVIRRIKRTAVCAYVVFAVFSWIWAGFRGFLGLTCSAAVTIICFLWLEEIAEALLQPAAHRHNARRLALRALGRFILLGVALLVTITVARFNAVSVLLGFSIIVVGIFGEALYSLVHR